MARQVGTIATKPVKMLSPISKTHVVGGENAPGKCICTTWPVHAHIHSHIHT